MLFLARCVKKNVALVRTFGPHTVPARWRRVVDWSRSAGANWSTGQHPYIKTTVYVMVFRSDAFNVAGLIVLFIFIKVIVSSLKLKPNFLYFFKLWQ